MQRFNFNVPGFIVVSAAYESTVMTMMMNDDDDGDGD